MTGRDFNERYTGIKKPRPVGSVMQGGNGSGGGGLTPRDTGYIITPEDSKEKADSNLRDAERLLTNYGDMLSPSERTNLEMVVAGGGRPQEMGLKEGALVALGRLGEAFDRPFQLIRHSATALVTDDLGLTGQDFMDIMSGNDEGIVERYGEEVVGKHGDMSGSQILRLMGVEEAETGGGKFARFLGAMAIETVLDPMTWFTGGFSGLGKKAALEAMEKSVTQSADDVLRLLSKGGDDILEAAARSSDEALAMIDNLDRAAFSQLDNEVFDQGTRSLREKISSGEMGEKVLASNFDAEKRTQGLKDMWLDEVDDSMGVNRTAGVSLDDGTIGDGFSWKRVEETIDPKTGEIVEAATPYNLLVSNGKTQSWYGSMLNELGEVIVNKEFWNPKKYRSWDAYLDHANAGKTPMWTTGGITFGFGKFQKEVPGLTKATRGTFSRMTRPIIKKGRKGPWEQQWTTFRENWSREGVQMVIAARNQSVNAASYADWSWLRSNSVLAASQSGMIAEMWRVGEIGASYRNLIGRAVEDVPKGKMREQASEDMGAAIGAVIGRNDAEIDLSLIQNKTFRDSLTPETQAEMLQVATDLNTITTNVFNRMSVYMPDLQEISRQKQAFIPLVVKTKPKETIQDILFEGRFPVDIAKSTDDEIDEFFEVLTRRARESGKLGDGDSFSLDHLYHLASLAPNSNQSVSLATSLGEKAVLSNRRFLQGGILVQFERQIEGTEDVIKALGTLRAFEDQNRWSRELAALLGAINDEYRLGKKIDFDDVLEVDPVVRVQSYIGQMQEALVERVGLAAAQRVGKARRKSFKYDAGALLALGAGENGFYRRLSSWVSQIQEFKEGLEHYRDLLGNPKAVKVNGVPHYFPPHLIEDPEFMIAVKKFDDRIREAVANQVKSPGEVSKRVRTVMDKSPKLSETEAINVVASQAQAEIVDVVQEVGVTIDGLLDSAFREVIEVVTRHGDEVDPKLLEQLVASHASAVNDAQDALSEMISQYVNAAVGQEVKLRPVTLDVGQFEDLVTQAMARNNPEILAAHATALAEKSKKLAKSDPNKKRLAAEAATYERAGTLLEQIRGDKPPPNRSGVEHISSGIQIGADEAALRRAVVTDALTTGGYAPTGFRTVVGLNEPDVLKLANKAKVVEMTSDVIPGITLNEKEMAGYAARTVANIIHNDATIVVFPEAGMSGFGGMSPSSGSSKTIRYSVYGPDHEVGGKIGFQKDYTATEFLEDFEEVAGAPGVWQLKPDRVSEKPILVVSYLSQQGDEIKKVSRSQPDAFSAQGKVKASEMARTQDEVIQQWFRDNNVKRLNVAGSRTRKGLDERKLVPEHRYGRVQETVIDSRTGLGTPGVEVKLSHRNFDEHIVASLPLPFDLAEHFQWDVVIRMLNRDTTRARLEVLEEAKAMYADRIITLTREGRSGEVAEMQKLLDSVDLLAEQVPTMIDNRGALLTGVNASKRPFTRPGLARTMSLDEVIEAAKYQYSDIYNTDIREGFTISSAGVKDFDVREFLEANVTAAEQQRNWLYPKNEKGVRSRRSIDAIRKDTQKLIDSQNKDMRFKVAAKNEAAGLSPGDEGYELFHPFKHNEAGLRFKINERLKIDGIKPGTKRALELEVEMRYTYLENNVYMYRSRYGPDSRLQLSGKGYGSSKGAQIPTQGSIMILDREAAQTLGVYRRYKTELEAAGLWNDDYAKLSDDEILEDVAVLQDMWESLRRLSDEHALEDGRKVAVKFEARDIPDFPFEDIEVPLYAIQSVKSKRAGDVLDIRTKEEFEDALRQLARMKGWDDWDTAPLGGVGYQEGHGFVEDVVPSLSGLYERLSADPASARDIRKLSRSSKLQTKIRQYGDIEASYLRTMFIEEITEAGPAYYRRLSGGGKGRRIDQVHIDRLSELARTSTEKYRKILIHGTDMPGRVTDEMLAAADNWFLNTFLIDQGHLEAARRIDPAVTGIIPQDPGSTDEILRKWMANGYEDYLDDFVEETAGDPMTLQDWAQVRHPEMMDDFIGDRRRELLAADAAGPAGERRATFLASIEEQRATQDLPLEWERQQLEIFEAAEAQRRAKIGDERPVQGAGASQDLYPSMQAPAEQPWQQWMFDVWEALMRSEGADQREAMELLEFYHSRFFQDAEISGRLFSSADAEAAGKRARAQQVNTKELDIDADFTESVSSDATEAVEITEQAGSMVGAHFEEAYHGVNRNDLFAADERMHGQELSDVDRLYATEMSNDSIVFTQDGEIALPAMFAPENHRYRSYDYEAGVWGSAETRRGPDPMLSPVRDEGFVPGEAAVPFIGPSPEVSRAARLAFDEPATGPIVPDERALENQRRIEIEQRQFDKEQIPPEDKPIIPLGPETRPADVLRRTDPEDIDPETGVARYQLVGEAREAREHNELLLDGSGMAMDSVDVEYMATHIVDLAADHVPISEAELITDLRRQAGKDFADHVMTPYTTSLNGMLTPARDQIAIDLGINPIVAYNEWKRYAASGDLNQLSTDAYRYLALAEMMEDGSLELGEIALDKQHRLNQRMLEEAIVARGGLVADARRAAMEVGEVDSEKLTEVASFVVGEKRVSKAAIKKEFGLSEKQAEVILADLEKSGVVSAKNTRGRRNLIADEASLRALNSEKAADVPGSVSIDAEQQRMLSDIWRDEVGPVVSGKRVRDTLVQRRRSLKTARGELSRLRAKHSARRAESIAEVTGQKVEKQATPQQPPSGALADYKARRQALLDELESVRSDPQGITVMGHTPESQLAYLEKIKSEIDSNVYEEIRGQLQREIDTGATTSYQEVSKAADEVYIRIEQEGGVPETYSKGELITDGSVRTFRLIENEIKQLDAEIAGVVADVPSQPRPGVVETPPPLKVDPSPEGLEQVAAAQQSVASIESQVRRLEAIEKNIVEGVEVPGAAATPGPTFVQGPSPIKTGDSAISGFTLEAGGAGRRAGLGDPEKVLYVGRKHKGLDNPLGYEEGFLGNPFVVGERTFNKKWKGKRHPMFGVLYVTRKEWDGDEQVARNMRYQLANSADEAAAGYHEVLWDWIEAHPAEAQRLAKRMAAERPTLYLVGGADAAQHAADVDVVSEAFNAVASGRLTRPENRWAAIIEGTVTGKHAETRAAIDAHAAALKDDIRARDGEVMAVLDRTDAAVGDTQLALDLEIRESISDVLVAADAEEASAVVKWINNSAAFERFMQLSLGEDVTVNAVLRDGKPIISYSRPGAKVAGVKQLDEKGLAEVVRKMQLPPSHADHIPVDEATKTMGPELTLMYDAANAITREKELLEKARTARSLSESQRPSIERVAAAGVAEKEFTVLMRAVWEAIENRNPDELKRLVQREVDGEWVSTESWDRISRVLADHDATLLTQVEDFVRMGMMAKAPMKNTRWNRKVTEMMGTMATMNTSDSSRVTVGQIEEIVNAVDGAVGPSMGARELDDFIDILDVILADANQALTYAKRFDEPTKALVEGFNGPMERMWNRYQSKSKAPLRMREDAGQRDSLPDVLQALDNWFDMSEVDARFDKTVSYLRHNAPGQYATDIVQERRIMRDQIRAIMSNPQVMQTEIGASMLEAGQEGISGRFASQFVIDKALASELSNAMKSVNKMTNDHNLRHLMRISQGVWSWWKRAATISRPSFHIRNFIGGMFNNMLIGVNPASYFDLGPSVLIYQRRMNASHKILEMATDPEAGFYTNVLAHIPERHRPLFHNVWKQNILETAFAQGDLGKAPGRSWLKPWKENWVPYKVGGVAMEGVESVLRVAAFAKYFDVQSPHISGKFAKDMVNTVHFDYVNLTPMEERIKKYVPFFVWSRRNIPLQTRTLMQSPRWAISYNRAKKLWNDEFMDDEDDPMLADLGFVTPWGRENDLGWARMMWSPDLPMMDILDSPLFSGRALGPTPFGEDSRNAQKWLTYGLGLAGPAFTIPLNLLEESDKTTNAPAGVNELLALGSGLLGKEWASASNDVRIPRWMDSALNSMIPFYQDYRSAIGMESNNPYRAASEGQLPGEQKLWNMPLDNLALGNMRTFGRGFGFQWATPMDEFFANRELETMIDDINYSVRTRLPGAGMSQATEAALIGG